MEWFQVASISGSVVLAVWYLHKDHREEMKAIKEDLKSQASRTDRLYEMFIELVKEKKEI